MELSVSSDKIALFEEPGREIPLPDTNQESIIVPAGKRRYIQVDLSYEEVVELFAQASVTK